MPRKPRNLQPGYCYHITIRCNNREFNLAQRQCRLTDDDLTQWHPAFLQLGKSLEEYAQRYRGFCQKYKGKKKPAGKKSHWGNKLLAGFSFSQYQISKKAVEQAIVEQFILANQAFYGRVRAVGFKNLT
ncbi:hypothetical protein GTQ43_26315 [Nostoc sp. KVJ3]|uniref:hypothetical protein n=1 Tax=Nostoc sp. KVJ3 TaxID=457945 RepID=UPI00223805F5|nr:hypothetical protein [Nostoc sp. KVJ3]MCW5317198.1 hypothetical protein [Nostoc sp. KVJ3]